MPPRKSNASTTSAKDDGATAAPEKVSSRAARESLGIEDLNLPRSMVQRLAKGALPANTQIQKEALLAMSKGATVFVSALASGANMRAELNNKKTVQPPDVFNTLEELGFGDFRYRVEKELERYTAIQCDKRNTYRRRIREEKDKEGGEGDTRGSGASVDGAGGEDDAGAQLMAESRAVSSRDGGERSAKRARLEDGADDETVDEGEGEGEDTFADETDESEEDEEPEEDEGDEAGDEEADGEADEADEPRPRLEDDEASDEDD